jgi:hypothetical protein
MIKGQKIRFYVDEHHTRIEVMASDGLRSVPMWRVIR